MTGFHHVAFACKDVEETRHFYEDLMGFPLVHTEMAGNADGFMRHIFFGLGDGSCLAFFHLNGKAAPAEVRTDISTGMGLPVWVNHVAFKSDKARMESVRGIMKDAGIEPIMEQDHGWCHSLYYPDPNGIMVELCLDTPGIEPDQQKARELLTAVPE